MTEKRITIKFSVLMSNEKPSMLFSLPQNGLAKLIYEIYTDANYPSILALSSLAIHQD